jgi:hypothetical protein
MADAEKVVPADQGGRISILSKGAIATGYKLRDLGGHQLGSAGKGLCFPAEVVKKKPANGGGKAILR